MNKDSRDIEREVDNLSRSAESALEEAKKATIKALDAAILAEEAKKLAVAADNRGKELRKRFRVIGAELVTLGEDRDLRILSLEEKIDDATRKILLMQGREEGRTTEAVTGTQILAQVVEDRRADLEERKEQIELSKKMLALITTLVTAISGILSWALTKLLGE